MLAFATMTKVFQSHSRARHMAAACGVVALARTSNTDVQAVAGIYFEVGHRYRFEWLRGLARRLPARRAWDKQAVSALMDELGQIQRDLVREVLGNPPGPSDVRGALEAWQRAHESVLTRNQRLMAELESSTAPDFAMLAVASRQLASLTRPSVKTVSG